MHGTFSLNLCSVFDIETIAGCLIIKFSPRISILVSDLRKMYLAHCQITILSKFRDIERTSKVSKKNLGRVGQNNFWQQNIKFQNIWDYRFYWNSSDKEKGIQVKTCITLIMPENLKILVSRYLNLTSTLSKFI